MAGPWPAAPGTHAVQFYEREQCLHEAVAAFFEAAARHADPLVMVARRRTFEAVATRLATGRHGPVADAADRILFTDVDAVLAEVMDGDALDAARCEPLLGQLLATAQPSGATGTICTYGEAVDVLCARGNHAAAVRLEEVWTSMLTAGRHPMAVLCGYAIEHFDDDPGPSRLRTVCRQHTHIVPVESVGGEPDDHARLEQVVLRQQRARVGRALGQGAPPAPRVTVDAPGTPTTIYIVDDDASVRRALARLLASVSLPARTFPSAEAFLAAVDPSSGGCLLVDIQLDGASGCDLLREVARAVRPLAAIAMSGSPDPQVEAEALRLGATTFLQKPFDAQTLLDAIRQAQAHWANRGRAPRP